MKRKLIAMLGAVLFTLAACSQKKEEPMTNQNPEINAKNIVEKLQQEVKQYPEEPVYLIDFGRKLCYIEIFINGIPVYKAYDKPTSSTATEINQAIFKSGTQKVTFRLYPSGNLSSENNINNNFSMHSRAYLNPEVYDKRSKKGITLKEYETPKIPNPVPGESPDSIFVATGKDYYEGSFTFEAQVPFLLQNFDKAQDLRKMDPKALEAKLLTKYKQIWSIFQNKDYDQIARIYFDKLKNDVISNYYTKEEAENTWKTGFDAFSNPSFEMQPIENYELRFFAEGKLAALITKSTDPRLRGSSALWAKFKVGDRVRAFTSKSLFYIPEGETEFKVY